jgi:hypothetical protein
VLMWAAARENFDVVKFLVAYGAYLGVDNIERKTAAMIAWEKIEDIRRDTNGSGLELRSEIRDMLRTAH